MKLLLALVVAASAAPIAWTMKYSMTTEHREKQVVSVEASSDTIRLCVEVDCAILTPQEASEIARVLLGRAEPRGGTSFEELADESARETDVYFCSWAKTEWERNVFCHPTRKGE